MIDHANIPVADVPRARAFYDAVMAVFDANAIYSDDEVVGYGKAHWQFGIVIAQTKIEPLHIAFKATSHQQVDAFYKAALGAGGTSNGAPGERPEYGEGYYAAFVTDLDGHNIEAVCRG